MRRASLGINAFRVHNRDGIEWLESPPLASIPWLVHAFSTRIATGNGAKHRDLNLGMPEGSQARALHANRKKFTRAIGAADFEVAALRQIHSDKIFEVGGAEDGRLAFSAPGTSRSMALSDECQGDALISQRPGVLLSVRTADCMPILLADVKKRVVATVHAGWRGALSRIAEKTVGEMQRVFGSRPQNILAAVGPSIGVCCYQVGPEVVDAFSGAFVNSDAFIERPTVLAVAASEPPSPSSLSRFPPGHDPGPEATFKLDLAAVARHQLEAAGVRRKNILISGDCTSCQNNRFFFLPQGRQPRRTHDGGDWHAARLNQSTRYILAEPGVSYDALLQQSG